jgi:UDP-glucose 6-dehydrogenase
LKCSSQKDYVILATRTPPKEEQNENLKHLKAKLNNVDEEWATEHASQVILSLSIIVCVYLTNEKKSTLFSGYQTRVLEYLLNTCQWLYGRISKTPRTV